MTSEYDFSHKFALLDVNILSQVARVAQGRGADIFRPVFEFLQMRETDIFLIDALYFELTAFISNKKDRDFLIRWVTQFPILPGSHEDSDLAARIASCYVNVDPQLNRKQISYADSLCAARIIQSKGSTFVVTTDIHDYPTSLFDVARVQVVDDGKKAILVGFITYNDSKLKSLESRFMKSG